MSLFNVNQTINSRVNDKSKVPVQDKQLLIVPDSGDLYYDFGGTRTQLSDIITLDTETQRTALNAPYEKFYFVKESGVLWRYNNGSWVKCSGGGSTPVNQVLTASAWADNKQSVAVSGLAAGQDGIVGLSQGASAAEREAAEAAGLRVCGQTDGTLSVAFDGDKPACDIPITVILFG